MQTRVKGTHEKFPVPTGSVLIITPSRTTSAARATSDTSGMGGPWATNGGPLRVGPFSTGIDVTVETTAGTVFVEVTSATPGTVQQITADKVFTPADDGQQFEAMGAYNLTFPTGLGWTQGISVALPASGTVSFVSSGGTLLNGATTALTRAITNQRTVAVTPRSAVNSLDLTGS